MEELAGRVAVVTGGASGIGRALCEQFAAEGMSVVVADLEEEPLAHAVSDLEAGGATVLGVPTDVSDEPSVLALRDATLRRFGAVHVICNNAGVATAGPVLQSTSADWRWVLGVNVMGVVHGVLAFTPLLVEQGEGHVVNTASMAGLMARHHLALYSSSKHAVVALSESLYREVAGTGVGVSLVCPSAVRTQIFHAERNRPPDLWNADGPTPEQEIVLDPIRQTIADLGIPPAEVAAQVVDAVRTGRFYVMTHPEAIPLVRGRLDDIEAGRNPSDLFARPADD